MPEDRPANARPSLATGKAVVLALTVALWQAIGVSAALFFAAVCAVYVAAAPFLLLGDVFGAAAARRAVLHLVLLPRVLRAHHWSGVRVLRVRMVPGGIAYLVQAPLGLTAEAQERVKRDGPGNLGVFEVLLAPGRRAGSIWVTLVHRDCLEDPRSWSRTSTADHGIVGRLARLFQAGRWSTACRSTEVPVL